MVQGEQLYGTYRCPVCGHREGAELDTEQPRRVVACSYCETSLEVEPRSRESMRFVAQVVIPLRAASG